MIFAMQWLGGGFGELHFWGGWAEGDFTSCLDELVHLCELLFLK